MRNSQFLRNITSNYVVTSIDALVFVLLTPFVVNSLGIELYAVWVILQTLGYYLDFFDLGVPDAQVRWHTRLHKANDAKGLARLQGTVFVLYLGAGGLAVLGSIVIALSPAQQWLDIPAASSNSFVLVLLLLGLTAAFSFLETGVDSIFEGYQRFDLSNAVHLVSAVVSALLVVGALAAGYGIVALALIACLDAALSAVAMYVIAKRVFPRQSMPRLGFDRSTWQQIKSYSLWNCLDEFLTEGTAQFDRLLIPVLLTSALVTPYSLVIALAATIFLLAEPITDTFLPIATSRHQRENHESTGTFLLRGTKLVTTVTLPTTVVVACFGQSVLNLWIGEEFTNVHPSVLWFTAANFFFTTYLLTSINVLMGAAEMKRIFVFSVIEVTAVLLLILLLVPRFALPGLALAGLIANVATGLILFIPAACEFTNMKPAKFVSRSLLRQLAAATPGLATAGLINYLVTPTTWLATLFAISIGGIATLASLLLLGMTRRERARYMVTVARLIGAR